MASKVGREGHRKLVIGWAEYVDFPEWGIRKLLAKVDTGAKSSALHVEHLRVLPRGRVAFHVVLSRKERRRSAHVEARIARRGRVRSSSGHYAERIFVETPIRIGPLEREVELNLVDRASMIHRMLLGRTALHGLLVDVGHKHLLGRSPRG